MKTNQIYVTSDGLTKLKSEYEDLTRVKRKEIAERIANAREMGETDDVNPEYEAAREEQSFIEGRILELEDILKNAEIIDRPKNGNKVVEVGSTVTVQIGTEHETYTIVGSVEAEPTAGKISHESPVGQSLLGLKVGDEVEVITPTTTLKYKIKKIS
ncbi:MAG TPA: transcription elongation factor GreA, partial [Patescibacteria group bacterium]|nr:transcription elongation factor GreA [Patescibacteria group bacterium]